AEDPKQIGKVKTRLLREQFPGSRVLHQLHEQIGGKGLQDVALGLGLETDHDEEKRDEIVIERIAEARGIRDDLDNAPSPVTRQELAQQALPLEVRPYIGAVAR